MMSLQLFVSILVYLLSSSIAEKSKENMIHDLSDEKWDQIQRGRWLVGFFDQDTAGSRQLADDWQVLAKLCHEQGILAARITSPQSPGLLVRFLVSDFPKVFYIKNGVAHEVPVKLNQEILRNAIKEKSWDAFKAVNFMSNPFSVQMSLLSYLFIHAVNLYNFEDAIVQRIIPISSATDIAFGLTFIIIGTFFGLLLTLLFGAIQIFFAEAPKEEDEPQSAEKEEDEEPEEDSTLDSSESSTTRKRK